MVMFYLRHFLGFLFQFGSAMTLCFLPWSRGSYRFDRTRTLIAFSLGALALCLIFPVPLFFLDDGQMIMGHLYMLGAILLGCLGYIFAIREHAVKKLLVINLAVVYAAFQFMLVNVVAPFIAQSTAVEVYSPVQFWGYLISTAAIFPFAVLMFRRTVCTYIHQVEPQLIKHEYWLVFAFSIAYFVLIIVYNMTFDLNEAMNDAWMHFFLPFLFSACVLVAFYWQLLRDAVRRKEEYDLKRHSELQQVQYEHITRDIETARHMRHDLRHYLTTLYDLAQQSKTEELTAYLSEVIDFTSQTETTWYCENITVNALLQNYLGRAREQEIACSVKAACGDIPVSPVDLTVILGNVLENALRACMQTENRWLRVNIGVIGGSLAIQVENSCAGVHYAHQVQGTQFLPADSFQSDRLGGGLGLQSIARTALKYHGDASFCYNADEHSFTTRVLLNLFA